ncbi:hypothetical protein CTI12_AA110300 [Artemisia annua]|uniref:Transmembrane protein 135 N-terminal domain-containing protein n=1 Tax=Artemisia annua TaxID=35608 RepID=A0A2U1PV01_ARTAN|nr:hypothetical protein CTI12_AA110300 [Artemisia annua]
MSPPPPTSTDEELSQCDDDDRKPKLTSSSSSYALLSFDSFPVEDYDKRWRIFAAAVKGFAIGGGIKGGKVFMHLIYDLISDPHNPLDNWTLVRSDGLSMGEILDSDSELNRSLSYTPGCLFPTQHMLMLENNLTGKEGADGFRWSRFDFSTERNRQIWSLSWHFCWDICSVDEFIAAVGGHRRTARWRALLAGAIAGPSMLLTGHNTQHTSLAVYIFMRAAVLASRCGIKSERFGRICKPLTWAHGDLFLMCLASTQILCAYILKQDSLPQTYKSFLNKHGGKDPVILQGVRDIACGMPFTNLEQIQKYYNSTGVDVTLDPQMKVPCSIIHGNQSCSWHAISFFLQEYKRAVPVYLPVYLIPALIVHRQGLGKRPFTILAKGLFGTARSSLFLTTYCTSAWVWTCFLFRIFKRCNVTMLALGTFPTGISLAIEKKSRRIEISLYCLARAIESFFTTMSEMGYMPEILNLKRVDVLIFSVSTAIIMHCYAIERDVFRSKYLNVLDWVFGVPLPPYDTTPRKKDETTTTLVWTCFLFRIFKRCNVTMLALGTFPTGISLAIEKKSRRIEISLYCLARAIESFFTTMSEMGYMPEILNLKRVDVLIFSVSTAIIMHCYAIERDVFRSKYLNVLDWVFGVPLPPYDTTPRKKDETSR